MLFTREVGAGLPIVVLHGGPGLDHRYLLPELDQLTASYRLVYYDQRGRGLSADGVRAEDVSLETELADLEEIQRMFGLERTALLGHSWGCVLAAEYATRHPERVSHVILLNTAPVSHEGMTRFQAHLHSLRASEELAAMDAIVASDAYRNGELDADAEYHRIHFRPALHRAELLEPVVARLRANVGPETILLSRAITDRLLDDTWRREDYDLRPRLAELDAPTLVLHGAQDFIPVGVAADVADSIPGAVFRVLPECGHFSYLEAPHEVEREVSTLLA